jgi:hypothetical protein
MQMLLLRELEKGETFASLLNIHTGDIHVVPTHLVFPFFRQGKKSWSKSTGQKCSSSPRPTESGGSDTLCWLIIIFCCLNTNISYTISNTSRYSAEYNIGNLIQLIIVVYRGSLSIIFLNMLIKIRIFHYHIQLLCISFWRKKKQQIFSLNLQCLEHSNSVHFFKGCSITVVGMNF